MARRRTHSDSIRSKVISIRVTDADHHRLREQAERFGMTVSGLAEKLVHTGRIQITASKVPQPVDPVLLAELQRIGNNLNQIAHAVNSNLPPSIPAAAKHMHDLMMLFKKNELLSRRVQELQASETANDSEAPKARDEFQRHVQIRSA